MPTFEEGFAAAESAADSVLDALNEATRLARQLRKASQDGNIAAIRRLTERLDSVSPMPSASRFPTPRRRGPFPEEEERPYLEQEFSAELQERRR